MTLLAELWTADLDMGHMVELLRRGYQPDKTDVKA